jgi:hypothetical protein
MKRRALKAMMARLELCVTRLSQFIQNADKLAVDDLSPRTRRRVKYSGSLSVIRENALRIHQALLQCWCNSHSQRRAGLLLDSRIVRQKRGISARQATRQAPVPTADCFAVCLDERLPGGKWFTTEIKVPETLSR